LKKENTRQLATTERRGRWTIRYKCTRDAGSARNARFRVRGVAECSRRAPYALLLLRNDGGRLVLTRRSGNGDTLRSNDVQIGNGEISSDRRHIVARVRRKNNDTPPTRKSGNNNRRQSSLPSSYRHTIENTRRSSWRGVSKCNSTRRSRRGAA